MSTQCTGSKASSHVDGVELLPAIADIILGGDVSKVHQRVLGLIE